MRLNPDCVRNILLMVEDESGFEKSVSFPNDNPRLYTYSAEEINYHIKQCELANLIIGVSWWVTIPTTSGEIEDLSPTGHEFIANIRSDTNWKKTKEIAKTVGSESLSAVIQIAGQVISTLISGKI